MPRFGRQSLHRLRTMAPRLQALFERVVAAYDCTILCGHRGKEAQNKAFREGRSKVEWPDGQHNAYPSEAGDVAPWPVKWGGPLIDWDEESGEPPRINRENLQALLNFYHFAGFVQGTAREMNIPIRWGGDWDRDYDLFDQGFNDLVHYEIDEESSASS